MFTYRPIQNIDGRTMVLNNANIITVGIAKKSTMKKLIGIGLLLWSLSLHAQISGEFRSTDDTAIRAVSESGRAVHGSSVLNHAIYGFTLGSSAVKGESSQGKGVEGLSQNDNGVFGESNRLSGVYGIATGEFGAGVTGFSTERVGTKGQSQSNYGIMGQSYSNSGVYGYSNFGYGVEGLGTNDYGVVGRSEKKAGVYATSEQSNGLYATSEAASAIYASSTANIGVYGYSFNHNGMVGASKNHHGIVAGTGSTNHFDFYASSAGGNNYGSASSRRWKENIQVITDPLQKISQLRGVTYDWDEAHGGMHSIGFIAEEVGAVLPEIVVYESNGIDAVGLDYSKVTPLLVEAIKAVRDEYQTQLRAQKVEIMQLRKQVAELLEHMAQ